MQDILIASLFIGPHVADETNIGTVERLRKGKIRADISVIDHLALLEFAAKTQQSKST